MVNRTVPDRLKKENRTYRSGAYPVRIQRSEIRSQKSERVVAGFPCQNSEFRNQKSERVVAGFHARHTQSDTDTRPGCDENKSVQR